MSVSADQPAPTSDTLLRALTSLGIPTAEEFAALKARVEELEDELDALSKPRAGARAARRREPEDEAP